MQSQLGGKVFIPLMIDVLIIAMPNMIRFIVCVYYLNKIVRIEQE